MSKTLGEPKDKASEQLEQVTVSVPAEKYQNCEVWVFCERYEKSGFLITKLFPHYEAYYGREIKYIFDLTNWRRWFRAYKQTWK